MRHMVFFVGVLTVVLVSACSAAGATTGSPGASTATTRVTVNMTDANQFQPATITVSRGSTVTWVNGGAVGHTVTDDAGKAVRASDAVLPSGAQPWDSGFVNGGASYSYMFDTPGEYTYFCLPHESIGMIGHVIVSS